MATDRNALRTAFVRWQHEGRIHPWTCREDSCHALLDMEFIGEAVTLRCHDCGYVQYLYEMSIENILEYGRIEWTCMSCEAPLKDGTSTIFCRACFSPEPRCQRCGQYESICGHSLPFAERIKSVNVDRSSLR